MAGRERGAGAGRGVGRPGGAGCAGGAVAYGPCGMTTVGGVTVTTGGRTMT
jgi:hypothetical protein